MNSLQTEVMAQKYQQIIVQVSGLTFSWKIAQKLVGGKKRLERLMCEERVRYDKPFGAPNTKWMFNASDILSNIKPQSLRVK